MCVVLWNLFHRTCTGYLDFESSDNHFFFDLLFRSSTREAQKCFERIAKLSGGVAVIKVYCSPVFILFTLFL